MTRKSAIAVAMILILGSSCLCDGTDGKSLNPRQWNEWFERLFRLVYPTENSQMVETLMLLHEHTAVVDPIRKEIVDFWHDAVMDKQDHCNHENLERLKEERQKCLHNGYNKDKLYDFVQPKVIKDCMFRFLRGVEQTNSLNPEDRSAVFELSSVWAKKHYDNIPAESELLNQRAANYIKATLPETAHQSKEDFIKAWRSEGACRKLLSHLEGPVMRLEKFYYSFNPDYESYQLDANRAYGWTKVIEGCKYFLTDEALDAIWPLVNKPRHRVAV